MANLNKELITKNIFQLLDDSGLTDLAFANLLDRSEKQIRLIKKAKAEFNIDDINIACDFFRKTINSINTREIKPDFTLRDKLILAHKKNTEYSILLESRPSITYAINYELLQNKEFKEKGLGVSKIRELFEKRRWKFESGYISTAMTRNSNKIIRIPDPEHKDWYLYKAKK